MSFDDETALSPTGDGAWAGEIVEGWGTPRGPLGGYVMAILMRGLELAVGDPERQARSVTMHFLRVPETGPVAVTAATEREGRSLSTVTGRLEQDGKLIGIAVGAYSKPWDGPVLDETKMPEVEPPTEVSPSQEELRGGKPPPFLGRMVMQHRIGDKPFSSSDRAEVGGWVGLAEEDRPVDALALAVLADAWFPAPWPRLTELAAAPTVDLTIHFRSPLPVEGPLLLGLFHSTHVRDGFFDENGELWSADGTLVAQSRQLGILLGANT